MLQERILLEEVDDDYALPSTSESSKSGQILPPEYCSTLENVSDIE